MPPAAVVDEAKRATGAGGDANYVPAAPPPPDEAQAQTQQ
jgi:hypothetical protein